MEFNFRRRVKRRNQPRGDWDGKRRLVLRGNDWPETFGVESSSSSFSSSSSILPEGFEDEYEHEDEEDSIPKVSGQ